MSFLKKKNIPTGTLAKVPFYKKKGWKIFFVSFVVILLFGVSITAYVFASGAKIFQNGISGRSLIKTFYGGEELKGETEDRINILLMGMGGENHPGGLLTDSLIVASYRPKDNKAAMISIPRDLLVQITPKKDGKINSAFSVGYNDYMLKECNKKNTTQCKKEAFNKGAETQSNVISEVLGVPIHYYVTVDFTGFEKIIDQLGGIDIKVEKSIYDPFFPADNMKDFAPFSIKAGDRHLDGKTALKYARSRHGTSGGDFDRASRQQQIIAAVKQKALSSGFLTNPKKILDVISIIGNSVRTNFSPSEMKSYAEMIKDINVSEIVSKVLTSGTDGELVSVNNGTYYLAPKTGNFKQIQAIAQDIFSTETKKVENAKITVLNGTKTAGIASKFAQKLESEYSLDVTNIANAGEYLDKTVIYDYTNGKVDNTIGVLKKELPNSSVSKKTSGGADSDITIILGEDFNQ